MELSRAKVRAHGPGMQSPLGVGDDVSRVAHADAQSAIEDLYGRLDALKTGIGEEGAPYDDAWARREVRNLWAEIKALDARVSELERRFPVFRHARIKEVFDDYLGCVFYNPKTDDELAGVSVAKTWKHRSAQGGEGSYEINDQILVAKTNPGFEDAGGRLIRYEEIGAGGGGIQWQTANRVADIPVSAEYDGTFWKTDNFDTADGIQTKCIVNAGAVTVLTHWG